MEDSQADPKQLTCHTAHTLQYTYKAEVLLYCTVLQILMVHVLLAVLYIPGLESVLLLVGMVALCMAICSGCGAAAVEATLHIPLIGAIIIAARICT
jgi:hypothetical protein